MNRDITDASRHATVIGGAALIAATLLFSAVFVWLAGNFGYPEVLDEPAAQVLPRLLALGTPGRAVWLLYGLIPLLLVPTALGVHAAARHTAPRTARAAVLLALLAAATMSIGLMRWPTLHWQLAIAHADASPATSEAIAATFASANLWLGRVVGEFFGELFLNGFFVCAAVALSRSAPKPRGWLLAAGVAASTLGALALLRNVTEVVAPIAELNNAVLPLWMLVLGLTLLRHRGAEAVPAPGMTQCRT